MPYLSSFVVSLALPALILCYSYKLEFDDLDVLKSCANHPKNYITKWIDMSQLKFESVGDGQIVAKGYFEGVAEFKPNGTLYIEVEIIKKAWGKYNMPIAQVKRFDLCKSLYDPNEVWYGFSSMIDPKNRDCPLEKGVRYEVNNWSSKDFNLSLPDPNLTGSYRIILTLGLNYERNNFVCVTSDVHLYKQSS